MYTSAADYRSSCLVGLHSGPSSGEDDFRKSFEAIEAINERAGAALGVILLVIDEGDHIPTSRWRRKFAELRRGSRPYRLAFITESKLARGVITAIDWLQPPEPAQQVKAWPTVREGIAWIEHERGQPMPILQRLYGEARKAGLPRPGERSAGRGDSRAP
jgi:hypothetical protein